MSFDLGWGRGCVDDSPWRSWARGGGSGGAIGRWAVGDRFLAPPAQSRRQEISVGFDQALARVLPAASVGRMPSVCSAALVDVFTKRQESRHGAILKLKDAVSWVASIGCQQGFADLVSKHAKAFFEAMDFLIEEKVAEKVASESLRATVLETYAAAFSSKLESLLAPSAAFVCAFADVNIACKDLFQEALTGKGGDGLEEEGAADHLTHCVKQAAEVLVDRCDERAIELGSGKVVPLSFACGAPYILRIGQALAAAATPAADLEAVLASLSKGGGRRALMSNVLAAKRVTVAGGDEVTQRVSACIDWALAEVQKLADRVMSDVDKPITDVMKDLKAASGQAAILELDSLIASYPAEFDTLALTTLLDSDDVMGLYKAMKGATAAQALITKTRSAIDTARVEFASLTGSWPSADVMKTRFDSLFVQEILEQAGKQLGTLTVLQALHRELDVGETRVGLCVKAKKAASKPHHKVADSVWKALLGLVPDAAGGSGGSMS